MKKIQAKADRRIAERLTVCTLFREMTAQDVWSCFNCSGAELAVYEKGELIYSENDCPQKMFLLVSGSVLLGRNSTNGRREVVSTLSDIGDILGAEDVFLGELQYSCYAEAMRRSALIIMPKDFLMHTCVNACSYHAKLISNMLYVFALKTKRQDERLEIMSSASLRQKIAKMLLIRVKKGKTEPLAMNRERMAEYLNVARPSLSRELIRMKEDGLIELENKKIYIADRESLQKLI